MAAEIFPVGDEFPRNDKSEILRMESMEMFGVEIDENGEVPGITMHPNFGGMIIFDKQGRRLIRSSVGVHAISDMLRATADELEFAALAMQYEREGDDGNSTEPSGETEG